MRSQLLFPALIVLFLAACNSAVPSIPATQAPAATQTLLPTDTATPLPTDTPFPTATLTPIPTDTPLPVIATYTLDPAKALFATEGGAAYYQSTIPPQALQNPVGKPLTSWHDIPIMPQATAGQEFSEHVYSYKAAATIDQTHQFYASNPKLMAIFTLTMPQSAFNMHIFSFYSYELFISITSQDKDPSQVTVIISRA
jgi:hypothetical protein